MRDESLLQPNNIIINNNNSITLITIINIIAESCAAQASAKEAAEPGPSSSGTSQLFTYRLV